jgi:hypothetical protein
MDRAVRRKSLLHNPFSDIPAFGAQQENLLPDQVPAKKK